MMAEGEWSASQEMTVGGVGGAVSDGVLGRGGMIAGCGQVVVSRVFWGANDRK